MLCDSNAESLTVVRGGERFESLSQGLQTALWEIGCGPTYHRTDNLKAAVSKVGFPKEYTDNYMASARHYGFESVDSYNAFVQTIVKQRNGQRTDKLLEELKVMATLPAKRYDDYTTVTSKVSRFSTITMLKKVYSVHSRLRDSEVTAKVFADTVEVWHRHRLIEQFIRHDHLHSQRLSSLRDEPPDFAKIILDQYIPGGLTDANPGSR